jgi:hypothetical protein
MKLSPGYSRTRLLLFLGAFISFGCFAYQTAAVNWNGYLQTDHRFLSSSPYNYSWQEHMLSLTAQADPNEHSHLFTETHLSYHGVPHIETSSDLFSREQLSPWTMDIQEAYVDLYGFLHENVDLRIGKQRIAWGTADNLNPTDNLNPDDLEDIWDFGRHMGSLAAQASFYFSDMKLSAVYIPSFTPALLPSGNWSSILTQEMAVPKGLAIGKVTDKIIMPSCNVRESSTVGLKIERLLLGYDLSLSYVYGRDDLPITQHIILLPTSTPGQVDIEMELGYPRMHIVGFDLAGTLWSVGAWGEMAIFIPEEVTLTTDLSALGMGTEQSIALDDAPYAKYVIGMDYTFTNGVYLNAQYLHGFIHERSNEELGDYLMLGVEWTRPDGRLILRPFVGGLEIRDFTDLGDSYGAVFSPEIVFEPVDGVDFSLGYRLIEGAELTTFGKMKEYDEIFFKVKYSF